MNNNMSDWKDNIKVVGITGFKRSGKDTVGEYLCNGHNYTRLGFADSLKQACKCIFSFTDDQLYGDTEKERTDDYWGHSPREILQKVGTELFREKLSEICCNVGNDIWIKSIERQMFALYTADPIKNNKFVITDVRFPNECDFIKSMNGKMARVNRFNVNLDDVITLHASEKFILDMCVDFDINNYGTLDDLYKEIERISL